MFSHPNSRASSRLRRAKSSSSDYLSYTRTEQGAHLNAAIAHLHALTAAEVAFETARGAKKIQEKRSAPNIKGQGLGRKESVRYTGPNAVPLIKRSITRRQAKNWDNVQYGKSTRTLEYKPEGYSPLLQRDYLTGRAGRRPTLSEVTSTSTSIRKAKSLLPTLSNGSQIFHSGDRDHEGSPSAHSISMHRSQTPENTEINPSSLAAVSSPPSCILNHLYSSNTHTSSHDRLLSQSRDLHVQQFTAENLSLHTRATDLEKSSRSRPFARTVRTSSANKYGAAVSSQSCVPPPKKRTFTMGKVARKLRKYFQKRDAIDPGGGLPDQQVNAERAHYWVPNSYNHGPPRLWSPPPAPDRIIVSRLDTRPETPVRTPMTVQNANRGAPVRRIGPLESMNSSASQSEQRREVSGTSTWEMSSIEAGNIGETSDPSKPKRPLTTIQEGQPYQSSSSRNAGTNTRPIGYGIFRDPMNIEHSGGRPFDAMQLARNLRLRREKSKYESLGSNETATDSRENLITRDQQGEVAYTNEQELYSRYLSRRSQEFRSPSNTAPGSHGVRQYQSLQHLSQGYNNHAESSHSFLPSTARDQSRFAADEIYSRNQAPYDQSQSIGPAPTLRDPGDEFSEDSGSIYSREPDGTRYFISENARSHGRAQPIRPMPRSPLLPPSPTFHAGNSSELGASDQSSPEMVSIDAVRLNSARPARESIVSPQTINGVRLATTIDSARIAARESSCKSPTTSTSAEAGQTPPSSVRLAKTPTTSGNLTRYKRQIGHRRGYRQLYNHNEQLVCRLRDEFPSLEQYHYPDPAKLDLSPDPPDYEQPQQAEPHAVSGSHEIECQLPALDSAPRSTSPLDHERPHGVELYEGYGTHERSEFEAEDSRSAPQSISPLGHEQPHGVGLYEGYSTYKRSEFENEDSRSAHTSTNLPSHEQELQMRSPSELNIPRSTPVPPEAKALKMSMPKFPVYGSGWDLDSENQRPSGGFKETRKTKTARLPSERQYGRSNNKNQPHLASQASQYAAATNFRVPPSNEYASNDMGYENQRQRGQYHNRPHGSSYTSDSDSPLARHSNRAKKMAASRKRMAVGGTFHAYVEDSPEDDSPALI